MQIIYDITGDKLLDSPRFMNALSGVVICALFLIFLILGRKDFDKKRTFFGYLFIFLIFSFFSVMELSAEWDEYKDNYYLAEYLSGNAETVEGVVKFSEDNTMGSFSFTVDDVDFEVISSDYNSRGYHLENYNNDFTDNDIIKVYFVKRYDESYFNSRNYSENVIARIEKATD